MPEDVANAAVALSPPPKKLQLKDVTLLAVEGVHLGKILTVVDHCMSLVDFGSVRVLTPFYKTYPNLTPRSVSRRYSLVFASCFADGCLSY